jgi:hypothetical protein
VAPPADKVPKKNTIESRINIFLRDLIFIFLSLRSLSGIPGQSYPTSKCRKNKILTRQRRFLIASLSYSSPQAFGPTSKR